MIQPGKKNPNCVRKSKTFIYLEQNQLSLIPDKVEIPQIKKKFAAGTNLSVIGILQNIKHIIQE